MSMDFNLWRVCWRENFTSKTYNYILGEVVFSLRKIKIAPKMTLPHIYYTINELSSIKNIGSLKNLNVKTIGYIHKGQAYEIDFEKRKFEKPDKRVQLDLTHISQHIMEVKPHIIFGVLYWKNQCLVLCVKSLRQFDADFEHLIVYHHQLLEVRKKSIYFNNLIGKENTNEVK